MRYAILGVVLVLVGACGLDVVGRGTSTVDVDSDGGVIVAPPAPDAERRASDDGSPPSTTDGAPAGPAITPSHIGGTVDPSAPDVSGITTIDTTTRTITVATGSPPKVRFPKRSTAAASSSSASGRSITTTSR